MAKAKELGKFSETIEEFRKLKKEFAENLKANFTKITKELFEEYPDLRYISWEQYAPYFNDGEACEFGVHEPSFIFAFKDGDENEDIDDDVERAFNTHGIDEEIAKHYSVTMWSDSAKKYSSLKKFSNLITDGDAEDLLKDMFGDDNTILIHADGKIDISDAEHD